MFDHFVALGADPRLNNDWPLFIAAREGHLTLVQHLITHHGADLCSNQGKVRQALSQHVQRHFDTAAADGDVEAMIAQEHQAKTWGLTLHFSETFERSLRSSKGLASAEWLADRVDFSDWGNALLHHTAAGRVSLAQPWLDRILAPCQPSMKEDFQVSLITTALLADHLHVLDWLHEQGIDVLRLAPSAIEALRSHRKKTVAPAMVALQRFIDRATLRQTMADAHPNLAPSAPRPRL